MLKELREWGNFGLTLLIAVMIPMGAIVLKNQRLEIQSDADRKYQTKEDANAFQTATNTKLDKITDAAEATRTDLATIKAQLANMNERHREGQATISH